MIRTLEHAWKLRGPLCTLENVGGMLVKNIPWFFMLVYVHYVHKMTCNIDIDQFFFSENCSIDTTNEAMEMSY